MFWFSFHSGAWNLGLGHRVGEVPAARDELLGFWGLGFRV